MPENVKQRLKILMQKYLDRTCTAEERNELVRLISRTSGPEEVNDLWRNVWTETDGSVSYDELSWEALHGINTSGQRPPLKVIWKKALKWSAVAAVLLCIYFVGDWMMKGKSLIIYETGYGERLEIVLDDGTEVNLNADSKLYWEKDWEKKGLRKVRLEGEAYFYVSHREISEKGSELRGSKRSDTSVRMPFEVLTTDVTIRVLGTAFNASQRRGKTEVFLESGSVELSLNQDESKNEKKTTRSKVEDKNHLRTNKGQREALDSLGVLRMRPGDYVSYSSSEDELVQKIIATPERPSEWKDGVLSYKDEEFQTMIQNLEDIYGKKFEVNDPELLNKRVNFSVPYKDWETVKEMMKWMLGIEIMELEDNHIQIKKQKRN